VKELGNVEIVTIDWTMTQTSGNRQPTSWKTQKAALLKKLL